MSYKLYNFTRAVAVTKSDTEYITNPSEPKTSTSAGGAIITIIGGAVVSVSLVSAGIGYTSLGTIAYTITGGTGSGATLVPTIVGGSIVVNVTAGGSGYTDGVYTSGSTYTLNQAGTGTTSNNVKPASPATIFVNCRAANETIKVLTEGGDEITFIMQTLGEQMVLPVLCKQVFSTGTTITGDIIAMW